MWTNEEAGAGLSGAVRAKRTLAVHRWGGQVGNHYKARFGPVAGQLLVSARSPARPGPGAEGGMKCLVAGGNVKGELELAGEAGARGTARGASLTPSSSPPSQCSARPSTLYPVSVMSSTWRPWKTG